MTIALGFQCVDGIMLCADTQETVGNYLKRSQSKIIIRGEFSQLKPSPCAVFAGACEDSDLADVLAEKLWSAIEAKFNSGLEAMTNAAEKELRKEYRELVALHPSGVPGTAFLVGIWASRNEFDLLKINGSTLKRNVTLDAIGVGAILATYLTSRMLHQKSWLQQAIPVGMYMVDQIKGHVDGCGGDTQIVTISSETGAVENFSQDKVEPESKRIRAIDAIARRIVGHTMDTFDSEEQFGKVLESDCGPLRKLAKIKPSGTQK